MIKHIRPFYYPTVSALALVLCICNSAQAVDLLSPRAEVNVRAGTERSILMTEFWAPLAQQSDRVLYGDLRLMGDGDDNREGNLGFGYRQISPKTNSVLGGNAWIDRRRTENGNTFHQLTLGVESLGDTVDLRANGYIQLNSSKTTITPNIGSATPYLAGSGIFFDTNGFIVEEPQHGFDAEIGYRLPILQKHIDATRVYAGGYHFFGDTTDNVTGFRLRTEAQVNSIFSIGARFQHDGPRGSQGFLEATLRFPFKSKKLYQEYGLKSRLDESPERDIDIVTGAKVDTGLMKPVINETSGVQQRILYVDNTNTNGGDGSKGNPFNTLAAAQSALQENDILYINRGDGTTTGMDNGITIDKANVQLIGSGSALTYNNYTLLSAGQAPVLTNNTAWTTTYVDEYHITTGNGIYAIANNTYISGINILGAKGHGIYALAQMGTQFDNITIENVVVTGSGQSNIYGRAYQDSGIKNLTLKNIHANSGGGIRIESANSLIDTIQMDNINAMNNASSGIFIHANSNGVINNVIGKNWTSTGNGTDGMYIVVSPSSTAGTVNSVKLSNIITTNNGQNGIYIRGSGTVGVLNNIYLEDVIASNNAQRGLYFNSISSSSILNDITVKNSIFNGNTMGIYAYASPGLIKNLNFDGVQANNNSQYGAYIQASTAGTIDGVTVYNSTFNNNRSHGLYLHSASSTSTLDNANISSSTFTNNLGNGIFLQKGSATAVFNANLGGGINIGDNRIFGNTGNDINIDRATISVANNWWNNGGTAPTRVTLTNGATATYTPPLATDPRP